MTNLSPDTLVQNRYRIVRQIGQGGFGAVYEAVDQRLESRVALKQLLLVGEEVTRAFRREAQLLANLRHPALPNVMDYFTDETGHYLVMQYIPGDDLGTLLAQRTAPFPVGEVLHWADQLLGALNYLHTRTPPILHRDIKPQNLKLVPPDEVVLLDFGLAKGSAGVAPGLTTGYSIMAYTPGFAPLEQIRAVGTTPQSDLYALAATIHHLLTNEPPIDAMSRADEARRGRPDPLRPVHQINPQVPPAVSAVLLQALALDAEDRPASAAAMRSALQAARNAPAPERPSVATVVAPAVAERPAEPTAFAPPISPTTPASGQSLAAASPQSPKVDQAGGRPRWLWPLLAGLLVLLLASGFGLASLARSLTTANTGPEAAPTPAATSGNGAGGKVSSQSAPAAGTDSEAVTPEATDPAVTTPAEAPTQTPATGSVVNNAAATEEAAGGDSQYPRALAVDGEATVAEAVYTILSAQLDQIPADEEGQANTDQIALRIDLRMTNQGIYDRNFWGDVTRVLVDDVEYAPVEAPYELVAGASARQGVFVFHVPSDVQQAVLQVGQIDEETATIPIDVTVEAAEAPTPTLGVTARDEQYPRALAIEGEATIAEAVYTILSAQLDQVPAEAEGQVNADLLAVRLEIRMTNRGDYGRNFWGSVARLLVDDVPYAPVEAPNEAVEGASAKQGVFVFHVPSNAQQATLQVGQINEETATIPLDLTVEAAEAPTPTQGITEGDGQYPLALAVEGEATAGEALYTLLSAELDQVPAETAGQVNADLLALRVELRMTNQGAYARNFWAADARLLIDDVSYAPEEAPNETVAGANAQQGVFVFHIPSNTQQAVLQVGQINEETATIPIDLQATQP